MVFPLTLAMAQQHLIGQCLLVIEASRLHSDTSQWEGLFWMRKQSDTETSHNTHQRQTFTSGARFKPTSPASKQPQTQALDHVTTGIGMKGVAFYRIKVRG